MLLVVRINEVHLAVVGWVKWVKSAFKLAVASAIAREDSERASSVALTTGRGTRGSVAKLLSWFVPSALGATQPRYISGLESP